MAKIIREEMRDRLREAIEQLPENQRMVLDLRLQGRSTDDIAKALEIKPETVRKRESRAVAQLRKTLRRRPTES